MAGTITLRKSIKKKIKTALLAVMQLPLLLKPLYLVLTGRLVEVINSFYFLNSFCRWSASQKNKLNQKQLQSRIIRLWHILEKRLALRNPNFANPDTKGIVLTLLQSLTSYWEQFGTDEPSLVGYNIVQTFVKRAQLADPELENHLRVLEKLRQGTCAGAEGGTRQLSRAEVLASAQKSFADLAATRSSVRQFADKAIGQQLIENAVRVAQRTPTVCNRQPEKAYYSNDPSTMLRVLGLQNGNSGFCHEVRGVFVITSDQSCFLRSGELHQAWVGGGMFSMSLVYALHAQGLGTCCLNWCVDAERDQALRKVMKIPAAEIVIMMIAVGHLPEEFAVAQSTRKNVAEVLRPIEMVEES